MDTGLAPYPTFSSSANRSSKDGTRNVSWSLDRVAYPVKYYLASLDGLRYVGRPRDGGSESSEEDASEEEYTRDVVALGALVKELFASVRLFNITFSDR